MKDKDRKHDSFMGHFQLQEGWGLGCLSGGARHPEERHILGATVGGASRPPSSGSDVRLKGLFLEKASCY